MPASSTVIRISCCLLLLLKLLGNMEENWSCFWQGRQAWQQQQSGCLAKRVLIKTSSGCHAIAVPWGVVHRLFKQAWRSWYLGSPAAVDHT
jgi:hypothetical protein